MKIKEIRAKKQLKELSVNYRQYELANAIGMNRRSIRKIMNGNNITKRTATKIAKELDGDVLEIFDVTLITKQGEIKL